MKRIGTRTLRLSTIALAILLSASVPTLYACGDSGTESCCKICREGKACGDSCISRDKTCNVGPGCACNG